MSKLLLSTILVFAFLTFSAQAQNRRLENLAVDLQQNADDLADKAYSEFTNRSTNSRSDIDNLLLAQQIRATGEVFRRLVNDNRSNAELRDVANALNDISRRANFSFSLGEYSRKVQRNVDDISRAIGGSSSGGEPKRPQRSPARNTAEVGNIGLGSKAQAVEMLIMAPDFCAFITGATRRAARMTFIR